MKSNEKTLLNDTIIFAIGNLGSKIIQFLLVPLYTYSMTTEEFGISDLLLTTVSILMPIFSFSVADGLLRFGLDDDEKKENVLKNSVLIAFIGSVVSFACIPIFLQISFIGKWAILLVIILNLRVYQDIFTTYLKVCNRNKLYAASSMIFTFTLCMFNVFFLTYLHLGIAGYLYSYIVASAVTLIYALITIRIPYVFHNGSIKKEDAKRILLYSLPLIVNALSGWIITASDRFMIEVFLDKNDLGIYSVATKMPSFIITFSSIFLQAWTISAIVEQKSEDNKKFYSDIYKKYLFVVLLGTSLLTSVIQPFMKIYVSASFFEAWRYVPLLLSSVIYMSLINYYSGIYIAYKKNVNITITILAGALINILLNALLIPVLKINGAVIATFISWVMVYIFRTYDIKKICDFKEKDYREILFFVLNVVQCFLVIYMPFKVSIIFSVVIILLMIFSFKSYFIFVYKSIISKIRR